MATTEAARYDPNETVVVDLHRSFSYPSGGPSYGPGEDVTVPRGLADALGLKSKSAAKAAPESKPAKRSKKK